MSRIHVAALLALSALAFLTSTAIAQAPTLFPPVAGRSNAGGVSDKAVPICQTSGGGTRTRKNCEPEPESKTVLTEQVLSVPIELRKLSTAQCAAVATTEFQQRNTIARVNSTLKLSECAAASGTFTFAVRVRDESGEIKPLEFSETWQRSDDKDVKFAADYPIGENVELVGVRVRDLRCTCADSPSEEAGESTAQIEPK